jgi:hypothetical protein
MSYRIGFDGVASAELTHVLRAVQNGLNGYGAGLLSHAEGQVGNDLAASTTVPCNKLTKECQDTKGPTEPPNVIVVTALIVVVTLLIGLGIGYRLGKLSAASVTKT